MGAMDGEYHGRMGDMNGEYHGRMCASYGAIFAPLRIIQGIMGAIYDGAIFALPPIINGAVLCRHPLPSPP